MSSKYKRTCEFCGVLVVPRMAKDGTLRIMYVHKDTEELACYADKAPVGK